MLNTSDTTHGKQSSSAPQFLGFYCIYAYSFNAWQHIWGGACFRWSAIAKFLVNVIAGKLLAYFSVDTMYISMYLR